MRRTWVAMVAMALAVPLALVGCSSGKKSASGRTATTSAQAGTTAKQAGSADPFCQFVSTYNDRFGKINLGLTDPQQFKTVMTEAAGSIRDAQASAPAAIKSDVGLLNEAFQNLLNILQQANFDVSKVSLASLQQLQTSDFVAASQRLDAYTRQNCG